MDTTEKLVGYAIYAPPQATVADPAIATEQPVFFPVGLTKLAVLGVCTFGLYLLYWFYRSWRQMPDQPSRRIHAAVATIFYPLTAYSLFKEVERFSARSGGPSRVGAGPLAVCLFLVTAADRLPDLYSLISLLAFLPLLPVAQLVNRINAQVRPLADPNIRLSAANIVGAAIGGLLLLAAVIGMIWGDANQFATGLG
jgi:hypothetical protein